MNCPCQSGRCDFVIVNECNAELLLCLFLCFFSNREVHSISNFYMQSGSKNKFQFNESSDVSKCIV